jgi:integrase
MDRTEAGHQAAVDIGILADPDDDGALAAIQTETDRLMREHGVDFAKGTASYNLLSSLVGRAMAEATHRAVDRATGNHSGRAHDLAFNGVGADTPEPAAPDTVTLAGLVERFLADPSRSAGVKANNDYRVVLRYLSEFTPATTPVRKVTRDHAKAVRELLMRLPANVSKRKELRGMRPRRAAAKAERLGIPAMSVATINAYVGKMSALFKWAVREGLADRNVAEGLAIAVETHARDARRPFSVDQLNTIFGAVIYREARAAWGARQWIPLIALYSGLRLNEIATLRCDDVEERDGVRLIRVRPDEEGRKKLKSRAAKRAVPIHPMLAKLGFLDFVARQCAAGDVLFPDLKPDARGYYSDGVQKWFRRHLIAIGAKKPRTSFHSFRHCFRDALREADVSRDAVLALGGWAGNGGVSETYGAGLKASTLARAIAKVEYPGLDLQRLQAK